MNFAFLEPVQGNGEILRERFSQRPVIAVRDDDTETIMLGRNSTTAISCPNIRRKLARVYVHQQQLLIQGHTEDTVYGLNETPITGNKRQTLHHDDIIALATTTGPSYKYRVNILSSSAVSAVSASTSNVSPRKRKEALQHRADEFTCAICLELLVQAHILVPCGHMLCQVCVASSQKCPTCRQPIQRKMPCPTLDAAIDALVQSNWFPSDDMKDYRQRKEKLSK